MPYYCGSPQGGVACAASRSITGLKCLCMLIMASEMVIGCRILDFFYFPSILTGFSVSWLSIQAVSENLRMAKYKYS
jgi:hypothetical protein